MREWRYLIDADAKVKWAHDEVCIGCLMLIARPSESRRRVNVGPLTRLAMCERRRVGVAHAPQVLSTRTEPSACQRWKRLVEGRR